MISDSQWLIERMAAFLIIAFVCLFGWVTIAPYFMIVPVESQQLIVQQITTIQNIMLAVVSYFFGQSQGNLKKDSVISHLVKNPAQNPPTAPGVTIAAGETATITTETTVDASAESHPTEPKP